MTKTERVHLAHRRAAAEIFIAHPGKFQVCDQCQAIWKVSACHRGICGICGSYRWRTSPEEIIAVATIIGRSPFPFTSGLVPRLDFQKA